MSISQTVFSLKSGHVYMVEIAMFNVQRAITPKVGTPVTVYIFCTLPYDALRLCEVAWKYYKRFQSYGADTSTW